jgi:hypothetical protein
MILYIPRICLPILLQLNTKTYPGNILITHRNMNVGTGNEAAQSSFLGIHKSDFRYSVRSRRVGVSEWRRHVDTWRVWHAQQLTGEDERMSHYRL